MIAAVVPAYQEEYRLGRVLDSLLAIKMIKNIIVILNGSNEITRKVADKYYLDYPKIITLVSFQDPLGIDVPRAVGAKLASGAGASYTLFVDGDMVGEISCALKTLLNNTIKHSLDLALTDCYPDKKATANLQEPIFYWRYFLNQELGLLEKIKIATPSHGPHVISHRMLSHVPWEDFAVPPTLLVHAVRNNFRIDIATAIPHIQLGSSLKNQIHSQLITETIIGDCLEALQMARYQPRTRYHKGKLYLGYHSQRRFDLLKQFIAGRNM